MGKIGNHIDDVKQFVPEPAPSFITPRRDLTPELQKYLQILGPAPKRCLEALVDLGLSDDEIGEYFKMPRKSVSDLRAFWRIRGDACRV